MKIFRYMSKNEFDKLINGETLINNTIHEGLTNSVGFCFMKVEDNEPRYAYEFLSGVVDDDVCVVFETKKKLTKSYGVYADPYGSFFDTITKDEYCTKEYNLEGFKIVEMAIPDFRKKEWKWETDIKKTQKQLEKNEQKRLEEEKERKTKKQLRNEFEKEKELTLQEFMKQVNENHKLDLLISGKIYKQTAYIEQVEAKSGMLGESIEATIKMWFK